MPKKNLIILGGGIAVIIAAIVALSLTVWAPPSEKDFEQAKTDVNKVNSMYGDLGTSLQAYSSSIRQSTPKGSSKAESNYNKTVADIDKAFDKLHDSKAINDKDVKPAYDALVRKNTQIISYAEGFVLFEKSFATCIDVFSVANKVSDSTKIAPAHKKAAADCLPVLDQMKKSTTKYFADYATSYASAIRKRQAVFDDYAAKKINDNDASSKITEIANTDLKSVRGNDDGLSKARQNASAFEVLKQLDTVLDRKIKQS